MMFGIKTYLGLSILLNYSDKDTTSLLGFIIEARVTIRLWPLDSQSCQSEVKFDPYSYNVCNGRIFEKQPPDYPFHIMRFTASDNQLITSRVKMTKPTAKDYKIELMLYPENPSGNVFYYTADESNKKVRFELVNYKVSVFRKVKANLQAKYTGKTVLTAFMWHHVVVAVGSVGYIHAWVDGIKQFGGEIGKRSSTEIPGTLTIGGDQNPATENFVGRLACVGFIWNDRSSVSFVDQLCKTTPWLPARSVNSLYLAVQQNSLSTPVELQPIVTCSAIQCAYACLKDIECFYVFFNDSSPGCKTCHLFTRKDDLLMSSRDFYRVMK